MSSASFASGPNMKLYQNAVIIEWNYTSEAGNPKAEGLFLVASRRNTKRVFTAAFRPGLGWATPNKGKYIYAWAALPVFPPLLPSL